MWHVWIWHQINTNVVRTRRLTNTKNEGSACQSLLARLGLREDFGRQSPHFFCVPKTLKVGCTELRSLLPSPPQGHSKSLLAVSSEKTKNLVRHIKTIHEKGHHCNSCDRVHNRKSNLAVHIENVHDKQCEAQIEHYSTADTGKPSLQKHGKTVHNNMNLTYTNATGANLINEYHCSMCEKTYKHKNSLKGHIEKMHEWETNPSSRSMETPSLKEHPKADYTNTGYFCCNSWMKTYKYRGYLERHIKLVHDKEQGSRCERSSLTFK